MAKKPAYTPRIEFECDGSTTHYQGCKCHEARHQAELEELRIALSEYVRDDECGADGERHGKCRYCQGMAALNGKLHAEEDHHD